MCALLTYENLDAALDQLQSAFGLDVIRFADGGGAEIRSGDGVAVAQTERPEDLHGPHAGTGWTYVAVGDPDAHFERARAAGAEVLNEPHTTPTALSAATARAISRATSGPSPHSDSATKAGGRRAMPAGRFGHQPPLAFSSDRSRTLGANGIRVEIAKGCPTSLAGHTDDTSTGAVWIVNPDSAGLDTSFVPGAPTEALICRYAARDTVAVAPDGRQLEGGTLFSTHTSTEQQRPH